MYPVIVAPPLSEGAVNATTTCPLPEVTLVMAGALGEAKTNTELDRLLAKLVLVALVAVTLKL